MPAEIPNYCHLPLASLDCTDLPLIQKHPKRKPRANARAVWGIPVVPAKAGTSQQWQTRAIPSSSQLKLPNAYNTKSCHLELAEGSKLLARSPGSGPNERLGCALISSNPRADQIRARPPFSPVTPLTGAKCQVRNGLEWALMDGFSSFFFRCFSVRKRWVSPN